MKASELIWMLGARMVSQRGRRDRVMTTDPRCRAWVASHQALLRSCLREPHAEVSLSGVIDRVAVDDLFRLEFESFADANDRPILCHPAGDTEAIRVVIGLVSDAEIEARKRRRDRETRGFWNVRSLRMKGNLV